MRSTLSFRMAETLNEKHNMREIFVPYVDVSKSKNNIYYISQTKEEAFEYLFSDAVKEYNVQQKRKDRKIDNYLKKLLTSEEQQKKIIEQKRSEGCSYKELAKYKKAKRTSYELIVSLGNMKENPEFCPGGERENDTIRILNEYIATFQERNPNAYMYLAAIHLDETGVIHAHLDIVFFSDSYKTGLSRRVSLNRALEDMGFACEKNESGKFELPITRWQNREREHIAEVAKKYNIEIVKGNQSRQHLNREQYIIKKQKEEIQNKEEAINNRVEQLCDFINSDPKAAEYYYSTQLTKKEKELEEIKENYAEALKIIDNIKGEYERV